MNKYHETDHYFSEEDISVDNKKGRISLNEKSLGKETVEDLYTSEKLRDFLLDLNNDSESLKKLGYDWIDIDSHGLEEIVSYEEQVCAVPIIVQKKRMLHRKKVGLLWIFQKMVLFNIKIV